MKHKMSFGYFNMLADNIVEVIGDEGVEITLEMLEECHQFVDAHFFGDFAMLINRINNYTYTFEAQLTIADYRYLKAIAFVNYTDESIEITKKLIKRKLSSEWNERSFSGPLGGRQQALTWLQQELMPDQEKVETNIG